MKAPSDLEASFLHFWHILAPDAPEPEHNYSKAIPGRRFEIDWAWPEPVRVGVEMQGGVWSKGAHVRPVGYTRDCVKLCLLASLGWRIFYLTADMLRDDPARWIGLIRETIDEQEAA